MRRFFCGVLALLLAQISAVWDCGTSSLEGPLEGSEADPQACDGMALAEPISITEQIERADIAGASDLPLFPPILEVNSH
ncbi:MAG: hypothetical protein OSA78_00985 [Flavobacteriales bacterium]|nr:hypothetical protein [Flavobacteriales bacterium]